MTCEPLQFQLCGEYGEFWNINGTLYTAQRRVPTNFTALRSRLVLELLIYRRLESGSGATLAQLLFSYSYADEITVSIPVRAEDSNIAESEVNSIMEWAEKNQMTLNLNKTWEMLLKSSSLKVPPAPLAIVERKTKLKLLGVTFEADPVNWDTHIDHVLSKASSRLYILRVCRFYGYPKEQLDLLFQSLIISVFTYAIEVWGCCYYDKYLKRIDKLFARAFKSGYCLKKYSICDILTTRDSKLWNKITSNTTALDDLLPPRRTRHLRSRGHDYILPRVRTSRFKSTFVNRCLFSIVCH